MYRWVPLKLDFLGAWKSVWLKHYPAYPVIIISLIMQRNLATKNRAKQESGLTTVRLKRDPPVFIWFPVCSTNSFVLFIYRMTCIHRYPSLRIFSHQYSHIFEHTTYCICHRLTKGLHLVHLAHYNSTKAQSQLKQFSKEF